MAFAVCGLPVRLRADAEVREWADHWADVYGLQRELVYAVIEVESGWNPSAISHAGAAGLMQLMPGTAASFGVTNRFDIAENIRGGVAYLAWLEITAAMIGGWFWRATTLDTPRFSAVD